MKDTGPAEYGWKDLPDTYVQYINKLDREHGRLLEGLLIGHAKMRYVLHKMGG